MKLRWSSAKEEQRPRQGPHYSRILQMSNDEFVFPERPSNPVDRDSCFLRFETYASQSEKNANKTHHQNLNCLSEFADGRVN